MAYEQTFKNIDNILRTDEGCGSELDYIEQKSWVLFLKYLDDLEKTRQMEAMLQDTTYTPIIAEGYRWSDWAMPRSASGEYDIHNALVGDDLIEFVNGKLFPYLRKINGDGTSKLGVESKIGIIFSNEKGIRNKIASGYNLRDILEQVDGLKFQTSEQRHELTFLYESSLNKMGNAGRNGGEYYTPRPLIRKIVEVVNPEIGKTVYDGACGSAGFLCEAYSYMHDKVKKTADEAKLQTSTFYGKELKALAYIIGIMNCILHGIESPNIIKTNTLTENLTDVQEKDKFDYILANPPFGAETRAEVQENFPIKTGETAYLFLQHFIKRLRAGGSAGIVIKNTFLSNTDNASILLRKKLLSECNLHTVLDLPAKVFQVGVKTVVLFFKKGEPTKNIWFYQLNLDRTLGKTKPLNEDDLREFVELQKTKADSDNSWSVDAATLDENFDLSVNNPNKVEVVDVRTPQQIAEEIKVLYDNNLHQQTGELLQEIFKKAFQPKEGWKIKKIGQCFSSINNGANIKQIKGAKGLPITRIETISNNRFNRDRMGYANIVTPTPYSKYELRDGDILMSHINSMKFLGRAVVYKKENNEVILHGMNLLRLIPISDIILSDFAILYFRTESFKRDIRTISHQSVNQASFNVTALKSLNIPIPPLAEQEAIVTMLVREFERIETLKANCERIISLCDDMKQALLRKAFNGEL